jgi:type I restriction enzyme, S subunit
MGSTHQTIYMPDIERISVPLPPLDEQDAIVDDVWRRLRPVDAAVDAIQRQIELLVERRQALIAGAVSGELDLATAAA